MPNYFARSLRRPARVLTRVSGHVGNRRQTPGAWDFRSYAAGDAASGARREDVGGMLSYIPFQHIGSAGKRKIRAACECRSRRRQYRRVAQRRRTSGTSHRRTQRAVRCCLLIAGKCLRSGAGLRSYRRRRAGVWRSWWGYCRRRAGVWRSWWGYCRRRAGVWRPQRCREGHQ
jgi:hypothetical protein